jgi:hypothetical protein
MHQKTMKAAMKMARAMLPMMIHLKTSPVRVQQPEEVQ